MRRNLVKFQKMMLSSLIRKYDVIMVILILQQLKKSIVYIFHCFFVFGRIKLKFGVRGNFALLISNLNYYRF